MTKETPSNCRYWYCPYNPLPPPENSQECIGCKHNLKHSWKPKVKGDRK